MTRINAEQLFPNNNIYENNVEISSRYLVAIQKIPNEKLGITKKEQMQARSIISSWIINLVSGMEYALSLQNIKPDDLTVFKQNFEEKLIEFINHPDHGIVHSYYVYKGMLHLAEKNGNPITPGSLEDRQAQLMSLLHDIAQTVPFTLKGTKFSTRFTHQKNDHAAIIASLTKIFGDKFGLNRKQTKNIAYGLENHDASYDTDKVEKLNGLDEISKLLHDADKLFGASLETDPRTIAIEMLKRNYKANRGTNGSYLFREEIIKEIRNLIKYGDRCLSDAVSLVRKEFHLQMCTQAGKEVAEERKTYREEAIREVYGYFFDLTKEFVEQEIVEYFNGNRSNYILSIVGLEQKKQPFSKDIKDLESFIAEINRLYETPIHVSNEDKNKDRYKADNARGLKVQIYDKNAEPGEDPFIYLDPSIVRFCFKENGRQEFLYKIVLAFQNGLPK